MTVDVRTMFFAVAVSSMTGMLAVLVVWLANRRVPGMNLWAYSTLSGALLLPMILLQGVLPQRWLTHALPTALFEVMVILLFAGACRFTERTMNVRRLAVQGAVIFLLYLWFLYGDDSLVWRIRLSTSWSACFFLMMAWVFFTERRKGLRLSTHITGSAALVAAVVLIFRLYSWGPTPPGEWLTGHAWESALVAAAGIVMTFVWMFCVMLLVNQYQTREAALEVEARYVAEQELLEARHEIERQRVHRMRKTVARELHDGIGGITATVAMLAGMGKKEGGEKERELLHRIEEMALEGNREVRDLMGSVENTVSGTREWLADMEEYARKATGGAGISLEWVVEGEVCDHAIDDGAAAGSLMRTVMEAVHNLVRHAAASSAEVTFVFTPHRLDLAVRDNGRGFTAEREGGRGVRNMRARVEELGGSFTIVGGAGTKLDISVPLPLRLPEKAFPPAGDMA